MQAGLVSIIIPTYNRAHLVADAIRSALAQDYPAKQVIVVDDGSTDDTRQVVSAFAGVEYWYQPNQGQAAARNAGLRACRGEYLASLDSDDVWDETFLSAGICQLREHGLNLVFLNWRASNGPNDLEQFYEQGTAHQRYFTHAAGDWWYLNAAQTRRLMLETCPAPSSGLVVRRSAMPGGWDEQMLIADDWSLLLDLVLHQPTASAFTMVPHWLKRVHDQNIYDGRHYASTVQELNFHDEPLLLLRYRPRLHWREVIVFQRRQAQHCINYAYHGYQNRETVAPLRYIGRAFRLAPLATGRRLALDLLAYFKKYTRAA